MTEQECKLDIVTAIAESLPPEGSLVVPKESLRSIVLFLEQALNLDDDIND